MTLPDPIEEAALEILDLEDAGEQAVRLQELLRRHPDHRHGILEICADVDVGDREPPPSGHVFGPFRARTTVQRRAWGRTLLADDERDGCPVALHVIESAPSADPELVRRLGDLVATLERIDARGVARFRAIGRDDAGQHWFARDWVPGRPLAAEDDLGAAPPRLRSDLGKLADAIARAHQLGLAHGAIDDEHLVVSGRDAGRRLTLVDLGLQQLLHLLGHRGAAPTADDDRSRLRDRGVAAAAAAPTANDRPPGSAAGPATAATNRRGRWLLALALLLATAAIAVLWRWPGSTAGWPDRCPYPPPVRDARTFQDELQRIDTRIAAADAGSAERDRARAYWFWIRACRTVWTDDAADGPDASFAPHRIAAVLDEFGQHERLPLHLSLLAPPPADGRAPDRDRLRRGLAAASSASGAAPGAWAPLLTALRTAIHAHDAGESARADAALAAAWFELVAAERR
ncbi:MAG: hypothetical protein ACE37K_26060 [Planctomycetota bacterium]